MCGCFENYSIFLQVLLGCGIVVGYCLCLYFGFASLLNISILDTLVYRLGLQQTQYGPSTAVGLLKSVVSCILISVSYYVSYKVFDYQMF